MKDSIISGAYDLHVHTAPDYQVRKLDDIEMAQRIIDSGMAGYAIKSHFSCTADRAHIINRMFPGCNAIGTMTISRFLGGMNPLAVDLAARIGTRMVWFPTKDSEASLSDLLRDPKKRPDYANILLNLQNKGVKVKPVRIIDEQGRVLPEVNSVLEVIAQHDLIMGTGHLSVQETVALVKAAYERSVRKIVITHISSVSEFRSQCDPALQRELLKYGAHIEHCVFAMTSGRAPFCEILEQIKFAGPDRVILSTDFGQISSRYPDEGLLEFSNKLLESGMSETDVRKMIVDNPRALLGLV